MSMHEARRRAKGADDVDVDLEGREVLEDAGTGGTRHVRGWRHLNPENVRLYLTMTLVALIVLHAPMSSLLAPATTAETNMQAVNPIPQGLRQDEDLRPGLQAQPEESTASQGILIEEDEDDEEVPRANKVAELELQTEMENLMDEVNNMHRSGMVMETEPIALKRIRSLQDVTRSVLLLRYGAEPYRYKIKLQFPSSHPEGASTGELLIELASAKFMPHAVYLFMTMADNWVSGAFHRFAPHVLQAQVKGDAQHLSFQEYSPQFPHELHTLGFAGRPGGPAFYISTVDNTKNHGPGSQGSETEADACFGKILSGVDVVHRIQRMPGADPDKNYFVADEANHVKILSIDRVEVSSTIAL